MSYLIALTVFFALMIVPPVLGAVAEDRAERKASGSCTCGKGFVPPF